MYDDERPLNNNDYNRYYNIIYKVVIIQVCKNKKNPNKNKKYNKSKKSQ